MSADEGICNMSQSFSSPDFDAVSKWSITDVAEWLRAKGHDEAIVRTCIQQKIDGKSLLLLIETDLKSLLAAHRLVRAYF